MISDLPLVPGWDTYDWEQIFEITDTPDPDDIATVVHQFVTNSDEPDFVAVMRLKDGTWVTLHAGCDFTGWGCHGDYVRWSRHDTLDDAITMGLTNESRRWLDLELP